MKLAQCKMVSDHSERPEKPRFVSRHASWRGVYSLVYGRVCIAASKVSDIFVVMSLRIPILPSFVPISTHLEALVGGVETEPEAKPNQAPPSGTALGLRDGQDISAGPWSLTASLKSLAASKYPSRRSIMLPPNRRPVRSRRSATSIRSGQRCPRLGQRYGQRER